MPAPVVCPSCREELDIPAAFRGRPVRCANCQATFTPPPADGPPAVPRPALRDEPRDDPRDRGDDAPAPRRPDHRAAARTGPRPSRAWLWLLLLGTFGVCCLGCGGLLVFAVAVSDPDLTEYKAPDGQFVAGFPGPVKADSRVPTGPGGHFPGTRLGTIATYETTRKVLGQPFDTYFVYSAAVVGPLRRAADKDRAVDEAVRALVADRPGAEAARSKARTAGVEGVEVFAARSKEEGTLARVFVAGDRVYVVGVTGPGLEPGNAARNRAYEFWNSFQLTDRPAAEGGGE